MSHGTHISYVDASNAAGEWNSTRRWLPPAYLVWAARSATLRWVTATPFGTPVEPEVNMAYTGSSGCTADTGAVAGRPSGTETPSRTTTRAEVAAATGWSAMASSVSSTGAAVSPRICARRVSGSVVFSGA